MLRPLPRTRQLTSISSPRLPGMRGLFRCQIRPGRRTSGNAYPLQGSRSTTPTRDWPASLTTSKTAKTAAMPMTPHRPVSSCWRAVNWASCQRSLRSNVTASRSSGAKTNAMKWSRCPKLWLPSKSPAKRFCRYRIRWTIWARTQARSTRWPRRWPKIWAPIRPVSTT